MSLLVKGKMKPDWFEKEHEDGAFKRMESTFRNWVTVDGQAGPSGDAGFKAEPGRYHLYVSYACPWAHRTLIFRQLNGAEYLYEDYLKAQNDFTGIVTVPVLWDKQRQTIVNNESSEIIRMLNSAFNQWGDESIDLYPEAFRDDIDEINRQVYHGINNGVYKCGFATTQQAYDKAFNNLFAVLDDIDERLRQQRYLVGEQITEADWRLFVTLLRFDSVYYNLFKCNKQRIEEYPALRNYLRELYQWPGITQTINMNHIKTHYYYSLDKINPSRIVPQGPDIDYQTAHNRNKL